MGPLCPSVPQTQKCRGVCKSSLLGTVLGEGGNLPTCAPSPVPVSGWMLRAPQAARGCRVSSCPGPSCRGDMVLTVTAFPLLSILVQELSVHSRNASSTLGQTQTQLAVQGQLRPLYLSPVEAIAGSSREKVTGHAGSSCPCATCAAPCPCASSCSSMSQGTCPIWVHRGYQPHCLRSCPCSQGTTYGPLLGVGELQGQTAYRCQAAAFITTTEAA